MGFWRRRKGDDGAKELAAEVALEQAKADRSRIDRVTTRLRVSLTADSFSDEFDAAMSRNVEPDDERKEGG